jgi:hypothetical protein
MIWCARAIELLSTQEVGSVRKSVRVGRSATKTNSSSYEFSTMQLPNFPAGELKLVH